MALTFDDHSVSNWYAYRGLFQKYGARATFYVDQFDRLSSDELRMLKALAGDGHEIGCHGLRHVFIPDYMAVTSHTVTSYMQTEVWPAVRAMRRVGFEPKTFAYPYGRGDPRVQPELLREFINLRNVSPVMANYTFSGERVLGAQPTHIRRDQAWYEGLLQAAEQSSNVVVFFAHEITTQPEKYNMLAGNLESICRYATAHHLRFYVISELSISNGAVTSCREK